MISVSLERLFNGEVVALFDRRLGEVIENIMDPNTPAKAKRKVTLELTLSPNENNREVIDYSAKVKTAPSAPVPIESRFFASVTSAGEVVFAEDNPRQGNLFEDPAETESESHRNVTPMRKENAQ